MKFTCIDACGRVLSQGVAAHPEALAADGLTVICGELAPPHTYREGDAWVPIPPSPSRQHKFDWTTKQWRDPRSIEQRRQAQWLAIKRARATAEAAGFTWNGARFDSDAVAQSRIQGAVQLATLANANSQPFSIDWTLADNTVRALNGAEMVAVGLALGQHIQAVHAHARALRQQLNAAATPLEVENTTWDSSAT